MSSPYKFFRAVCDRQKVSRVCADCGSNFEVVTTTAVEGRVACLECDRCLSLYWYDPEIDPTWLASLKQDAPTQEIEKRVEELVPSCQKCGGRLIHIDWYTNGAPSRCPTCKKPQAPQKKWSALKEIRNVQEEVDWLKHANALQ